MSNKYYENTRFLIISPTRSGGTLLSHAIDSHPDIFCYRSEPLHRLDPIRMISKTPFIAIDTCLKMPGYEVSGCKLTYDQYKSIGEESIKALNVHKIIHLHRENALERIVSEAVRLQDKKNGLRTHTREDRALQMVNLDPVQTLKKIEKYHADVFNMQKHLRNVATGIGNDAYYEITYEKLCTYRNVIDRDLGFELQKFLGLSSWQMLKYSIVKRNPYSLQSIITNYNELYGYMHEHAYKYLKYLE